MAEEETTTPEAAAVDSQAAVDSPTERLEATEEDEKEEKEDNNENGDNPSEEDEDEAQQAEAIQSVLAGAADRIDEQLKQMGNSRRLFYRSSSRQSGQRRQSSWAHLSTSVNGHDLILQGMEEDDSSSSSAKEEETKEATSQAMVDSAKRTTGQYANFLASAANLQVLQTDLAQAEEIFYNSSKKKDTSTLASTSASSAVGTSSTIKPPRLFKMQQFNPIHYNDVEHVWKKRPFTVDSVNTFFGTMAEDRMEQWVQSKRSTIAKCGSWDPEGLVLTDLGRPFRSKLLLAVNDEGNLPDDFRVEYLSGTFVSYVYQGPDFDAFSEWVEDAMTRVKRKYGKKPNVARHMYAYYPSRLETTESNQAMVVLFVKVGKVKK